MTALTPYLCVADAREAIDWYSRALGAQIVFEPIVMDDGRVGHVELAVGEGRWMMSDPFPDIAVEPPLAGRGAAVTLHLLVTDCDAAAARVVEHGVSLDRGPEDAGPGRVAVFHDPFGHRWFLTQPAGNS